MSTDKWTQALSDLIRKGDEQELDDALKLAMGLEVVPGKVRPSSLDFSINLFIATSIIVVHEVEEATLWDVFNFLTDPRWDCADQIIQHVCSARLPLHPCTSNWFKSFARSASYYKGDLAKAAVHYAYNHWKKSFSFPLTAPSGDPAKNPAQPNRSIRIFDPAQADEALLKLANFSSEKQGMGESVLNAIKRNNGYRALPDVKAAVSKLGEIKSQFANLAEPIERLQLDLVLAGEMEPNDFYVMPILLLGDPGIGKTFLGSQLASILGVGMEKMGAASAQGAFQLNGSHPSWTNGKYGSLVKLLAEGDNTSPVILLDEVDKMGGDLRYPILPALLDLLEPKTSKQFRDEFLEMEFDCSRMVFILTANDISTVPDPLLSRVNVFDVPRPDPVQRLQIILQTVAQLQEKTKHPEIEFDADNCEALAERTDLDLRRTTNIVRTAMGNALQSGSKSAKLAIPPRNERRSIGFFASGQPAMG